jgi:transposase
MSKKRTQYSAGIKPKLVLAAVRNEQTMSEPAAQYGVRPTMINQWKTNLVEGV